MKKKISVRGLLSVWALFVAIALGIGALAIGGVQGRNMGIIAGMAAIAFVASLGGKSDDAQAENRADEHP